MDPIAHFHNSTLRERIVEHAFDGRQLEFPADDNQNSRCNDN